MRLFFLGISTLALAACLPQEPQAGVTDEPTTLAVTPPPAPPATTPPAPQPSPTPPGQTTEPPAEPMAEPEEPATIPPLSRTEAARFLVQSTFGPTPEDIETATDAGLEEWFVQQVAAPWTPYTERLWSFRKPSPKTIQDMFWERAVEGEDQLRLRVAYALSQLVVVSADDIGKEHFGYATYMDILHSQALGNYEDLIREVSLSNNMGLYLTHLGSQKGDPETGVEPDENYAREVMQLFTIGTEMLRPDGTSTGEPTYDIDDVKGLARVFTGFSWANSSFEDPKAFWEDQVLPMKGFAAHHDSGPKTFLGHTVPGGLTPEESVRDALDHLLAHDNVPPLVAKHLIQRLVTSNPTGGYVERVARAYDEGRTRLPDGRLVGSMRRGDMQATVAAILFDPEARSVEARARPGFGKVREPVAWFAQWARAFRDGREAGRRTGQPTTAGAMHFAESSKFLGQKPYAPPSVFSHFRPDYAPAGFATQGEGLVAPEMQVITTATVPGYVNFIADAIEGHYDTASWRPDYAEEAALAGEAEVLVDHLDELLTYGTLGEETKARIVAGVEVINAEPDDPENEASNRVKAAILMIMTSPEYMTQR